VHTKLYIKPTDKKQYLHFTSAHPTHIKKAIPYSQALRYKRIIDKNEILLTELDNLKTKFIARGYPKTEIERQINRVHSLNRLDTLKYKTYEQKRAEFLKFTRNGPFLPFIITYKTEYTNAKDNLYKSFNDLWKILLDSNIDLQNLFKDVYPQIVFKRDNTLASILIRAKFTSTEASEMNLDNTINILAELHAENIHNYLVSPCQNSKCKLCNNITVTNTFSSTVTKKTYNITEPMNCNTTSVIYLITCLKCQIQYVGETKRKLKDRFNNHRSDIKLHKQTAVSIHFNNILHNYNHISVVPIELVIDSIERKTRENYWIKELNSRYPLGLNHYPI